MRVKNFQFRLPRIANLAIVSILPVAALVSYVVFAIIHATKTATDISEFVKKFLVAGKLPLPVQHVFDCRLSSLGEHRSKTSCLRNELKAQREGFALALSSLPSRYQACLRVIKLAFALSSLPSRIKLA
jgi:hypothetical protein